MNEKELKTQKALGTIFYCDYCKQYKTVSEIAYYMTSEQFPNKHYCKTCAKIIRDAIFKRK